LRTKVELLRPLLAKIAKREAIVEERVELEVLMQNPERLTARGPKAREDRKREEDMQRRVKSLEKVTKEVRKKEIRSFRLPACLPAFTHMHIINDFMIYDMWRLLPSASAANLFVGREQRQCPLSICGKCINVVGLLLFYWIL
jgi:hypothetical protein